jgi:hypothetical protein
LSEASGWVLGGTVRVEEGAGAAMLSGRIRPSLNSMQSAVAAAGFRRSDMLGWGVACFYTGVSRALAGGFGRSAGRWQEDSDGQQGAGRRIRTVSAAATKAAVNRAVA